MHRREPGSWYDLFQTIDQTQLMVLSVQDLNSLGVSVDPYFITKAGEEFDQEYYWNVCVSNDCHLSTILIPSGSGYSGPQSGRGR